MADKDNNNLDDNMQNNSEHHSDFDNTQDDGLNRLFDRIDDEDTNSDDSLDSDLDAAQSSSSGDEFNGKIDDGPEHVVEAGLESKINANVGTLDINVGKISNPFWNMPCLLLWRAPYQMLEMV